MAVTPRLSIVTPSFQQGEFIEETIQSVLRQSSTALEYWIVDGGSTDNTLSLIEKYQSSLHWISEPDKGQSDAINKGFKVAKGALLGWLNADDIYLSGVVSEVIQEFQKDPNLMLLYGDAYHINNSGERLDKYPSDEFDLDQLAFRCFICQPTCFFRRELIEEAGYLNAQLRYALDLDLWIRFGQLQKDRPHWKFKYVPRLWAYSRMHKANKTLSKRKESYEEISQVVKQHFGFTPFNWVYGQMEARSGSYDGYFRKSPMNFILFVRSIFKWILLNRQNPLYLFQLILHVLVFPANSIGRLTRRFGEKN